MAALLLAAIGASGAAPGHGSAPPAVAPQAEEDELTTGTWREPEPVFELHWELLRLPEMALRLALTPLLPVVAFAEEHRLDRRVYDLLTNDEETALLLPVVVVLSRDGVGAGFDFRHSDLRGGGEQLRLKAVFTTNGDRSFAARYAEKLVALDGRELAGRADYELDQNERTYGVGGRTRPSDVRLLEVTRATVGGDFELGGPSTDLASFGSDIALTYTSERLRSGVGAELPVVASGDTVAPPPAFGERIDYASAMWTFRHDLRDSSGRTGRGTLLELELAATSDLDGRNLNAGGATLRGAIFVPVAPRHRVIALSGGVSAVTPWTESSEVPYHALVRLGRSDHLRGYAKGRFVDRLGAWTSAEYRYPIFEFRDTGVGLSSTLFVDAGTVAGSTREFADNPLRVAYGFGVRGETAHGFVFRAQVGFSEEGAEALFSLNDTP
jgi:hypothetical protein